MSLYSWTGPHLFWPQDDIFCFEKPDVFFKKIFFFEKKLTFLFFEENAFVFFFFW